jgi:hypothetical protein
LWATNFHTHINNRQSVVYSLISTLLGFLSTWLVKICDTPILSLE